MLFYSEVPGPSYKIRSGETCSVVMVNQTTHSLLLRMRTFSQTGTLTPAIQVGQKIPLFTTRVQNVCACARSPFSKWRLRIRTSQQERLF